MRRFPLQVVLVAAAAGACAPAARGQMQQEEGPLIVGERKSGYKSFEVQYLQAALDFFGENRLDRLKQSGFPTLTDRELTLRETLDVASEVYIGHKNLIDITSDFKFGVEDRFINSDTLNEDAHETDFTGLYDVSALILQNGPVPLTVYSRRDQSLLDREFAGSIRETVMETGAIAQIKSDIAPTTVQYFHRDQDDNDLLGITDYTLIQDTFTGNSDIRIADNQHLQIDYTFDHINETQAQGQFHNVYNRNDATLTHSLDFGPQDRNNLRSIFRYYDETGKYAQQLIRLDEQLLLRHTDRFETQYDLTLADQSRAGADQRLLHGDATARYHLFDSLVASGTVGGDRLDVPGEFESDGLFVHGSLDYTKQVPYGRVDAGVSGGYNAQHNSAQGGTISVVDEPHVFSDPFPIVLDRPNIVTSSIVVTSATGVPTYLEGTDYTVQTFSSHVEIRVIVGGRIQDGQTVLVSYDLGPQPGYDTGTTTLGLSFRYTFTESFLQGLSFYTTYRDVDQNIDAENPSLFVLDNVRDLVLGTEYNRGPLTLTLEHENRDSTINPYDSTRFLARLEQKIGRDSTVSADLTHEIIDYHDPSDHVEFDRIGGRLAQRIGPDLDLNLRLLYRDERDRLSGNSHGFEQLIEVRYRRRQTQMFVSFRNSELDGPGNNTLSQTLQFGVRRAF